MKQVVRGTLVLVLMSLRPLEASELREPRYLTFTAQDRHGIYLRDLKMEEVSLYLDGEPVEVRYLGYRNVDTAFAFLIENSPRTAQHARSVPQWGMINIVDQVRYHLMNGFFGPVVETGPVLLAEFYQEFQVLQDFTAEDHLLELALSRMQPHFTGLDRENIPVARFLGRAVDVLRERPERRKILALFTTTIDRDSYQALDEYQQLLRRTDVELYVVSFAPRFASGPGYAFEERMNTFFFRRLVGETGGRAYISGEYVYVDEFMNDLMTRLANSYTIGFYPPAEPNPKGWQVRLRVRDDRTRVTHRERLSY